MEVVKTVEMQDDILRLGEEKRKKLNDAEQLELFSAYPNSHSYLEKLLKEHEERWNTIITPPTDYQWAWMSGFENAYTTGNGNFTLEGEEQEDMNISTQGTQEEEVEYEVGVEFAELQKQLAVKQKETEMLYNEHWLRQELAAQEGRVDAEKITNTRLKKHIAELDTCIDQLEQENQELKSQRADWLEQAAQAKRDKKEMSFYAGAAQESRIAAERTANIWKFVGASAATWAVVGLLVESSTLDSIWGLLSL